MNSDTFPCLIIPLATPLGAYIDSLHFPISRPGNTTNSTQAMPPLEVEFMGPILPLNSLPSRLFTWPSCAARCQWPFHPLLLGVPHLFSPQNSIQNEQQLFSHQVMSDSFVTPWTIAPLSVGFPRQECWSGLPFPSPSSRSCWDKRNECSVSAGIFFF